MFGWFGRGALFVVVRLRFVVVIMVGVTMQQWRRLVFLSVTSIYANLYETYELSIHISYDFVFCISYFACPIWIANPNGVNRVQKIKTHYRRHNTTHDDRGDETCRGGEETREGSTNEEKRREEKKQQCWVHSSSCCDVAPCEACRS